MARIELVRADPIGARLRGVACPCCGNVPTWAIRGGPRKGLNSITAAVCCQGCGASFFVKLVTPERGEPSGLRAKEEFDAAERTYAAFPASERFAAAKPYLAIPERHLLLFENVEGRNAADLLRELGSEERLSLLMHVGAWLKAFHVGTGPQPGPADAQEKLCALLARAQGNRPSLGEFDRAVSWLRREVRSFLGMTFQHVGLHGDCKLENFLVRGAQVVGIDVAWKYRNIAEHDLAQFLAQLSLAMLSPLAWVSGNAACHRRFEEAFLRGYGVEGSDARRMIDWLKRYYILSCWLSWRGRGHPKRLVWDICFSVLLRKLNAI